MVRYITIGLALAAVVGGAIWFAAAGRGADLPGQPQPTKEVNHE